MLQVWLSCWADRRKHVREEKLLLHLKTSSMRIRIWAKPRVYLADLLMFFHCNMTQIKSGFQNMRRARMCWLIIRTCALTSEVQVTLRGWGASCWSWYTVTGKRPCYKIIKQSLKTKKTKYLGMFEKNKQTKGILILTVGFPHWWPVFIMIWGHRKLSFNSFDAAPPCGENMTVTQQLCV